MSTKRIGVFADRPTPVVDQPAVEPDAGDGNIRNELLRLLRLPVATLSIEPDPRTTSSGAMLARILLIKATKDGNQAAITEVLDRIEGKATKAAANKPTNDLLNDQIDDSLEALDKLTSEN